MPRADTPRVAESEFNITMKISLDKISPDARNANAMSDELFSKLVRNIQATGLYPQVIVRPDKRQGKEGRYVVIDGHHRVRALAQLQIDEADCVVWDLNESQQLVALATLNRLQGEDNQERRNSLIAELAKKMSAEQISTVLPESAYKITKLLSAISQDPAEQAAANAKEKPEAHTFSLYPDQYVVVRNAMERMKRRIGDPLPKNADGAALEFICAEWLEQTEAEDQAEARMAQAKIIGAN